MLTGGQQLRANAPDALGCGIAVELQGGQPGAVLLGVASRRHVTLESYVENALRETRVTAEHLVEHFGVPQIVVGLGILACRESAARQLHLAQQPTNRAADRALEQLALLGFLAG